MSAKHTARATTPSNRMLHDIASMLYEEKNRQLDNLASEINKCHNDKTKMYQAVKFIKRKYYKT